MRFGAARRGWYTSPSPTAQPMADIAARTRRCAPQLLPIIPKEKPCEPRDPACRRTSHWRIASPHARRTWNAHPRHAAVAGIRGRPRRRQPAASQHRQRQTRHPQKRRAPSPRQRLIAPPLPPKSRLQRQKISTSLQQPAALPRVAHPPPLRQAAVPPQVAYPPLPRQPAASPQIAHPPPSALLPHPPPSRTRPTSASSSTSAAAKASTPSPARSCDPTRSSSGSTSKASA